MYDGILQELIDEFGRLPGVGPKSAQRIAFHVIQTEAYDPARLAELLATIRDVVKFCSACVIPRVEAEPRVTGSQARVTIAVRSVDAVAGLAGLHHSEDQRATVAECLRVPTERLDGDLGVEIDCADGLLSLTHDGDYTLIRDPGCPDARTPWRDRTTGACLAEELRRLDPDETYARALRGTKRLQHTTR